MLMKTKSSEDGAMLMKRKSSEAGEVSFLRRDKNYFKAPPAQSNALQCIWECKITVITSVTNYVERAWNMGVGRIFFQGGPLGIYQNFSREDQK